MDSQESPSSPPSTEAARGTSRVHTDNHPLPTDSMVTVSLSEDERASEINKLKETAESDGSSDERRRSSVLSSDTTTDSASDKSVRSPTSTCPDEQSPLSLERTRTNSTASALSEQVDWAELEKTEEREGKENVSDNVCRNSHKLLVCLAKPFSSRLRYS